jgi:branched-chain amino acid transport system ATP-binding protein
MTDEILRVVGLSVGYGKQAVITGMDLSVCRGEVVALLGRNGAGKTTTLMTIAGALAPIRGEIMLNGAHAAGSLDKRARHGLGFVTEDRAIIRHLTVRENLRLGRADPGTVFDMFPELAKLHNRRAGLLSGGEQQMLALGRCLAVKPSLVLIDELSLGLAPLVVERLLGSVRQAAADGSAVLLVEQKAAMALSVADRGYVVGRGSIELSGTSGDLLGRLDAIESSYLTH